MAKILITGGSGFIGTNLIEYLSDNHDVRNLDWNPPLNIEHEQYWKECDIMDVSKLESAFSEFKPDWVIHMAARTDTDIYELTGDLDQYIQNTQGTRNVIECSVSNAVSRLVITSSMFVCKPGYMPKDEFDFSPFTLYGLSKQVTEEITHQIDPPGIWTIIRPQTIWGPWSLRYAQTMFPVMEKGLYLHPDLYNVRRAYGFVGNLVWQVDRILSSPAASVHKRVFYVGDKAVDLREWVSGVSQTLVSRPVRFVPPGIIRALAKFGDGVTALGMRFPITSTRYNSMSEDYLTPVQDTYNVLGAPPYDMRTGIDLFIYWYKNIYPNINNQETKKVIVGVD